MILDPAIRDWVLFPIMIVMVLVGVLRHHITILLTSAPIKPKKKELKEQQSLNWVKMLAKNGDYLAPSKFEARKQYFLKEIENGTFLKDGKDSHLKKKSTASMLTDPSQMETLMGGMKRNVAMVVPQTLIMSWINFFFSGFVLIQLPFPLTLRFKSMLQSGILASNMDVAWVSSLSWYFLNLFGLRAVFSLVLGEENSADGVKDMQAMSMPTMNATMPGQQSNTHVFFKDEAENLAIHKHRWELEDIEERVLFLYSKDE
ncbi:transmembrane protein [Neoconidiobolus thromboides FSU 785]|nr:transmembrane protein [Neoconidiobolus thromboides FSU 785]